MNRLSACLITLNEEHNLGRALASLKSVADEIVVVDSGSTDRTRDIAEAHGAAFHFRPWTSYAEQKNFAAAQASHEWIFSIDADEELSTALQRSLLDWKKRKPHFSVYEVSRKTWYLGAWINHSGWYPDFQRRLFRRDAARFAGIIHESLRFDGQPGRLHGDLLHYTIRSMDEHHANVEKYSTLSARQMFLDGKRNWRGAFWVATPWTWFQTLVLKGGFLDGRRGWTISHMAARTVRLKYAKLGALIRAERRGAKVSA